MNIPLDLHTAIDIFVIVVGAFQTFQNSRLRAEVLALKVWIIANFERRKDSRPFVSIDGGNGS